MRVRLAPRFGVALAIDDARGVVRGGYGVFLNQRAYSVQTAFARNLLFFTKQVDVPTVPVLQTKDILASTATRPGSIQERRPIPQVSRIKRSASMGSRFTTA
jgi:hypothetical protein